MGHKIYLIITLLVLTSLLMQISCAPESSPRNSCGQTPCYEGPFEPPWVGGLTYISPDGDEWTHDNKVLETESFLVFSDSSSDEAKLEMGEKAEKALEEIIQAFEVSRTDLGIIDQASKWQIYAAVADKGGAWAGTKGFVIYAFDSPSYLNSEWLRSVFYKMIKHETTHVVMYNMGGYYAGIHDWFVEGLAEHISGGVHGKITSWAEVEEWRSNPDHHNPVSIIALSQMPKAFWAEHYPMFRLAFRYILAKKGFNRSLLDIKTFCLDIKSNVKFPEAFERLTSMPLSIYEARFYDLIKEFLPDQRGTQTIKIKSGISREIFEKPPLGQDVY